MKKVKIALFAVVALSILAFAFGCFNIAEVQTLTFNQTPAATYYIGQQVNAGDFELEVKFTDNKTSKITPLSAGVTVTGLVDGKLDTATAGIKTVTVTYRSVSVSHQYEVLSYVSKVSFDDEGKINITTNGTVTLKWAKPGVSEANAETIENGDTPEVGIGNELSNITNTLYVSAGGTVESIPVLTPWKLNTAVVEVTEEEAVVETAQELAWVAAQVNSGVSISKITLTKNIDLLGAEWTPIGGDNAYTGDFDGGNKKINNLSILDGRTINYRDKATTEYYNAAKDLGLFGTVKGGTYKNVNFENVRINAVYTNAVETQKEHGKNLGSLIGYSLTSIITVENVTVDNAVLKGNGRVGGVVGYFNANGSIMQNVTVTNSEFYAHNQFTDISVATSSYDTGEGDKVGGAVGQAAVVSIINSKIKDVVASGTRDIGGVVGFISVNATGAYLKANQVTDTVVNVTAQGVFAPTKGTANAGGIVGTVNGIGKLYFGEDTDKNVVTNTVTFPQAAAGDLSNGQIVGGRRGAGIVTFYSGTTSVDDVNLTFPLADGSGMTVFKAQQTAALVTLHAGLDIGTTYTA